MREFFNKKNFLSSVLSIALSLALVSSLAVASTTISTDITTEGTLTVTGASTFNGAVTLGDAGVDSIIITGNASTTNALTVGSNLYIGGRATTTASTGNIGTLGNIGAGTTTPTTLELSAQGSATTTIGAFSSTTLVGGCIQLKGTNGTLYRMYVATGEPATTTPSGKVGFLAVWEVGSCK